MTNLNFVANMTQRFLLGKRLIRYFSNFSNSLSIALMVLFVKSRGPDCVMLNKFAEILNVSDESLGQDKTLRHTYTCTSHEI